jgi:hypothetical protein
VFDLLSFSFFFFFASSGFPSSIIFLSDCNQRGQSTVGCSSSYLLCPSTLSFRINRNRNVLFISSH